MPESESEHSAFHIELTPEEIAQRAEAERTVYQLAHQVGVRCCHCGNTVKGHDAIGAISWMTPWGTRNFTMQTYCKRCADFMTDGSE